MNKVIVYANKKYVVIDDNKNISKPKVFTNNTLDILQLENEKEKIDSEIISLEDNIKRINNLSIESTKTKIIRMLIEFLAPFLIYASIKTYYIQSVIDIPLIISVTSALIIYPMSLNYTKKQKEYKKEKESIDLLLNELSKDKKISNKIENKIKELKEEEFVTRNNYKDFDVIDVNTKEKVKQRVLKK